MEIYAVKINGLNNPIGFDYEPLLCSWKVRGSKGTKQIRARILVATDKSLFDVVLKKEGDLNCGRRSAEF